MRDHEFLVLVGPSGCGKSTALRMIAGLEEITGGDLYIGDRRVNDIAPKDRDIAMVFQNYALYPHMTRLRQHGLRAEAARMPRRRRSSSACVGRRAMLGIERVSAAQAARAFRRPAAARRAGPRAGARATGLLARRAALEPGRQAARADARRDQPAAPATGNHLRLCHPRSGRGDDDGRPHRRHERRRHPAARHAPASSTTSPANLFVAGFIGSPAMDLFSARLLRGADGAQVVIGDGADARHAAACGTPAETIAGQATSDGRPVIAGIRPEDLRLAQRGQPTRSPATAEVRGASGQRAGGLSCARRRDGGVRTAETHGASVTARAGAGRTSSGRAGLAPAEPRTARLRSRDDRGLQINADRWLWEDFRRARDHPV